MKQLTFILLTIAFCSYSCSGVKSSSNILDSQNLNSKNKRIKILKKEIKLFSDFENAEFNLFNVNGFSNNRITLPGASSWDYKFALKVKPSHLDKWINDMVKIDTTNYDITWTKQLIEKRESEWKTNSKPEFYTRKRDHVMLVLYRNEGIIFKRVINN